MAAHEATSAAALRERYHTLAGDLIQLFALYFINPAPIPVIYGAIEALVAEPNYTNLIHDLSKSSRPIYGATPEEIDAWVVETHSDLRHAVVVAIAASCWLAAADRRDPQVQEIQHLLGDALTAVAVLSTVLKGLEQARAITLRGGTPAIPVRPSYLPLLNAIGRPSANDLPDHATAGVAAENSAEPSQHNSPVNGSKPDLAVLRARRRQTHENRRRAKNVTFRYDVSPYVVVREEAAGISLSRPSDPGMGSMPAAR